MTNEEAKLVIRSIPEKIWSQFSPMERVAVQILFDANEKQIPKKPRAYIQDCSNILGFKCPSCEFQLMGIYNHCPYCGQRVNWEGGE